jgi:hypothetical protein
MLDNIRRRSPKKRRQGINFMFKINNFDNIFSFHQPDDFSVNEINLDSLKANCLINVLLRLFHSHEDVTFAGKVCRIRVNGL